MKIAVILPISLSLLSCGKQPGTPPPADPKAVQQAVQEAEAEANQVRRSLAE